MDDSTAKPALKPIRIIELQPQVNGTRPSTAFAVALLEQARREAPSTTPEALARTLQAETDRRIGDYQPPRRWSLRRMKERLTYDIALRLFVFAVWTALMAVLLLGIVVGE